MKHLKRIFESNEWVAPSGDLLLFLDGVTQEIKDEYDVTVSYTDGYKYSSLTTTYIKFDFDNISNEFNSFKVSDLKAFNSIFFNINEKLSKVMEKIEAEGYWCNITLDMIGGDTTYTIEFSETNLDK